ncbi:MAG: RAD55 family ATPase, partial [Limisphaerales bacterium]
MSEYDNQDLFCQVGSIHGFPELFGPAAGSEGRIRFGSTLLISGPPGAGKTTFALATVRAMMSKANKSRQNERTIAYYVSSEVHEKQLKENFKTFGWFLKLKRAGEDGGDDAAFKFRIDSPVPDETNFYAITPMPEVDRPVPSPEELVNGIFNRIAHTLLPSEAPTEHAKIYVIVDSITALLKGCANAGEERRQTHEIMRRLQDRFGKRHLALTVLLAEHDHRSQHTGTGSTPAIPTEPSVEDYLADIVFRLYVRSLPLGRRSRILEVVKSQGVNMTLGEHTWQIVSADNSAEILRLNVFREEIEMLCRYPDGETNSSLNEKGPAWGGIAIFPRPRLQIKPESHRRANNPAPLAIGIPGFKLNVKPGSITLITGPMGCGKTTLCKQFLENAALDKSKRVLISFDVPSGSNEIGKKFTRLHFTQSQFDLNVLVAHINWILAHDCERMAFDGLSEWITMFDKPEAARVLEALMVTVKRPRDSKLPPPAVFMTYETALDDDPLGPAALGTAADNLVVVRQVPINDQLRRVIYVLKEDGEMRPSEEAPTHRHPGELLPTSDQKLSVDHASLEAYTGLLNSSRQVQPARVLIQLFAENHAERGFNKELVRRIKNQYARRVSLTSTTFSLSEIGSTLETAFGASKPGEAFNLAIHSVDEWWLNAQETGNFLQDLQAQETTNGPKYQNFWWFEVEKALGQPHGDQSKADPPWHAIPGYLDFGMFCINLDALHEDTLDQLNKDTMKDLRANEPAMKQTWERKRWQKLLSVVPRLWAQEAGENHEWFRIGSNEQTVLSYALKVTEQEARDNMRRKPVFTFDSSTRETCACMFFELVWGFGASESFLATGSKDCDRQAAKKALLFLQFMVMEGLMPARSSSHSRDHGGQPILFSRHWYSSLQREPESQSDNDMQKALPSVQNASKETEMRLPRGLVALPFMPIALVLNHEGTVTVLERAQKGARRPAARRNSWGLRMVPNRERSL